MKRIYALLLRPHNLHQQSIQPINALLQRTRLLANLSRLRTRLPPRLALHHDIKINQLLRQRAHIVLEAKRVFARLVGGEDVVALVLPLSVEEDFIGGRGHGKVNVECTAGLDGEVELGVLYVSILRTNGLNVGTHADLLADLVDVREETQALIGRDSGRKRTSARQRRIRQDQYRAIHRGGCVGYTSAHKP